jgi:hypothetical protein
MSCLVFLENWNETDLGLFWLQCMSRWIHVLTSWSYSWYATLREMILSEPSCSFDWDLVQLGSTYSYLLSRHLDLTSELFWIWMCHVAAERRIWQFISEWAKCSKMSKEIIGKLPTNCYWNTKSDSYSKLHHDPSIILTRRAASMWPRSSTLTKSMICITVNTEQGCWWHYVFSPSMQKLCAFAMTAPELPKLNSNLID